MTGSRMIDPGRRVRHAVRALARSPSFTTPVVLTLALGIGASTLIFAIVNGVLLRPLPYPDQDRLVEIVHAAPELGFDTLFASRAIYFSYREHNDSFESLGLWDWDGSPATIIGTGAPVSVPSVELTHEVLGILGADAVIGRTFSSADDLPESAPTAVISHGFWQRQLGGVSPLGRTLRVDGVVREVIGVLPESFTFFGYPAEIFYPLQPRRATAFFPSFDGRAIARLRDGVTLAAANADVGRMLGIVAAEFPPPPGLSTDFELVPRLRTLKESIVGELDGTLWTLMGTVLALLLIACANVANLSLVRAESRHRDLAIRAALGAARSDVAKLVFAEAAVLAIVAGTLGLGIATVALPMLLTVSPVDLPHVMRIGVDRAVLAFALTATLLALALLTIVALAHAEYSRYLRTLRLGARTAGAARANVTTRHCLLVAQVALALFLLVGSGLMLRTFLALRGVDPGFDRHGVQTFQIALSSADAASVEEAVRIEQAIADRLAALPGVEAAAFAAFNDPLPVDGDGRSAPIYVENPSAAEAGNREITFVSPGYFRVLATPLVSGRAFDWDDVYDERRVALVSEGFARAQWGSAAAAVGRRIARTPSGPWIEVVGVLGDIRYDGLTRPAPQSVSFPIVVTDALGGARTATFVVRSERAGAAALLAEIAQAVASVNGNLSPANVRSLTALYEDSMAQTSLALLVLVAAGAAALVLGLVGIYGVYSYAAARRKHEIGIRIALGAPQRELRRMFVAHALALTSIGVVVGAAAAVVATRWLSSLLFGVSALDLPTYAASALLVLTAAALASYVPARRASAVDPLTVLNCE